MKRIGILLLLFLFHGHFIFSQDQSDTIREKKNISVFQGKAAQKVMGTIRQSSPSDTLPIIRSEDSFLPYEGRIIRKIIINQLGFDRTISDTSRWIKTTVAKIANRLHNDSKSWVIRDNLFIHEGKPLNPYRLADNERYLRNLNFILDSRIYVLPLSEESDSVDILVMTRDVFGLGAAVWPYKANTYYFRVQEANLGGMGQRVQVAGVYDYVRSPKTGFEFLYQKANLFGSFINASIGYTEIDSGRSVGHENEYGYFFRLNRPLFHPYARWTGGLEWSRNWSNNNFNKTENSFANYQYDIQDVWAGYSFGTKKLSGVADGEKRDRTFVAVRAFNQEFGKMPDLTRSLDDRVTYVDRSNVLGQWSFFKQNFYKTRYLLGFGRTEDIPYGYRISFTGGWEKEGGIQRAYTGAEVIVSTVNTNGTFYTYSLTLGNYIREDLIEDALAQIDVSRYSRLYIMGKSKVRYFAEIGFASQLNQILKRKLDIRDINGISGFMPDSLRGSNRLRLKTELVMYTPWKPLGFQLAAIANIELAYLAQEYEKLIRKENCFAGFAAGLRARNENLVFNTVEVKGYYYPNTIEGLNHWRLVFRINLPVKYSTKLVVAPATVYDR